MVFVELKLINIDQYCVKVDQQTKINVLPQLASRPLDPFSTMDQVDPFYVVSYVHNFASFRSDPCLNYFSALFYLLLNKNLRICQYTITIKQ